MLANWVSTVERMPEEGAAVSFLIERRTVWMAGTYRCGCFESHWGRYDGGTVKHWRPLVHSYNARLEPARHRA